MHANTQTLIEAACKGDVEALQRLIPLSVSKINIGDALVASAKNGHTECVRLLLPHNPFTAHCNLALHEAAFWGHTQCVHLLLPVSDPKASNSQALRGAAYNGHTECLKPLIGVSDPCANNHEALRWAAYNGAVEVVRLLLPHCGQKSVCSTALQLAIQRENDECVDLLWHLADPMVARQAFEGRGWEDHMQVWQKFYDKHEKQPLVTAVAPHNNTVSRIGRKL